MKYASKDLMNEHTGILFGLKILEQMVNKLKAKQDVEIADFKEMVNFLKLFADKCHHGKEEGFFFPALEAVGLQKDKDPLAQMYLEHIEGRKYIAQMTEATTGSLEAHDFIQAATRYLELLRSHINKEDTVIFPYGDKNIPADEQAQLLETFDKFEEEVMGAGTHDQLHELLHRFEQKYLK